MMKRFVLATTLALSTALVALTGENAHAAEGGGLFVEPMVTYELGNTRTQYPSFLSDSTGTVNGLGLGARVGFHVADIVFLALDGRYSMPQYKDSSVNADASANSFSLAPIVGVQTPVLGIRAWAGYVLAGQLDPAASGSPTIDAKFEDPKGFRIGAGIRFMMLSLNLEYQNLEYGKTTLEQWGPFTTNTDLGSVKMKNESWIASVSFPIAL